MLDLVIAGMKSIFGDDSKRINHALEVLKHSLYICDREVQDNSIIRNTVAYTAILHDIGIRQAEAVYKSTAPVYQHREGPPLAKKILDKTGIDGETKWRILYIIGNHHLKSKIDGIDFQILWEADLITNLPDMPIFKADFSKYQKMVLNNFKTVTGKNLALSLRSGE
ncbi:MAG: phosphohydrolase [Bacillota bacterium]